MFSHPPSIILDLGFFFTPKSSMNKRENLEMEITTKRNRKKKLERTLEFRQHGHHTAHLRSLVISVKMTIIPVTLLPVVLLAAEVKVILGHQHFLVMSL